MASPTDAINHDDDNGQYTRPETTKRRKHGEADNIIMGASPSYTTKASPGSKESPIDIDGEEDPAWMAPPRQRIMYGSRLQDSRPRRAVKYDSDSIIDEEGGGSISKASRKTSENVTFRKGWKESREAKYLDSSLRSVDSSRDTNANGWTREGPVFGASIYSGGKNDLETDFTTKKAASGSGSALLDPVSTTTATTEMEDLITGAATYANMNTIEKPRGRVLAPLKTRAGTNISPKPKGPPGPRFLPGTAANSIGHAFASSTPSLNRPPIRFARPVLYDDTSSEESSESESGKGHHDAEGADLLGSHDNNLPRLDAAYAPLQPTRDPPPPSSARKNEVIEIDEDDNDTVSENGSIIAQVRRDPKESNWEHINGGEGADENSGGVPLSTTEHAALLGRVDSDGAKDEDDSDGERICTPPREEEIQYEPVKLTMVRFGVFDRDNEDYTCILRVSMSTPFHIFRTLVAKGMGWHGVSGACFRFWVCRDPWAHWGEAQEHRVNGINWAQCLRWIKHHSEEGGTSVCYMEVSDHAEKAPTCMSDQDKETNQDWVNEENSKFRLPQNFGGDRHRSERWTEDGKLPLNGLPLDAIGGNIAR